MFSQQEGDRRFHDLGLIRDTGLRLCPEGDGLSALYEAGVWRTRVGGVPNEVELVAYDRRCMNGHEWTDRLSDTRSDKP